MDFAVTLERSGTLPAGRECPLSGRLTFGFSGGAAAQSAATGC
jgi:hypothetical protein